jgi:hypothetical protein
MAIKKEIKRREVVEEKKTYFSMEEKRRSSLHLLIYQGKRGKS